MINDNAPIADTTLSLSEFLHFLFDGLEGYIYAPTYNRELEKFNQIFVKHTQLPRLEQHIVESSQDTDVYLSPSVFKEPKAIKENFIGSNVVWCEFDGNFTPPEVLPSLAIKSSNPGHVHCYWKLDTPIDNAKDLEDINRALAYSLNADKSGWDANQVLRPPNTWNFKRSMPVTIMSFNKLIHNVGDFSLYNAPDKLPDDSIRLKTIPDVMDVIYEYPLGLEFKDLFTSNISEGQRSTAYVELGYLAAEAGVSNEELYSLLRNFDDRIGKYAKREDRHRRLLDIIERVRLKYPTQSKLAQNNSLAQKAFELYDIISFGNQSISVEWLLPGLLHSQGNMLLSGPPGVGKTQLALNFAYGLASGTDTLGFKPAEPCRVLFISAEMGSADLKYFTDKITARYTEYTDLLRENLYVLPIGEPMYLNTKPMQEQLKQMATTLNLKGIIFDSLGSATNKSLSDETTAKDLLDFNDRFRNETGAFTWFLHHNRKATEVNKEPSALADIFGSQYITGRATSVISLWPIKANILKVRELKMRLSPQKDDWYIKRDSELKFNRIDLDSEATVVSSKQQTDNTKASASKNNNTNPFKI